MGLFKRGSVSSVSVKLTTSQNDSSSLPKVKPGELNFGSTSSPNSRLLALPPDGKPSPAPLVGNGGPGLRNGKPLIPDDAAEMEDTASDLATSSSHSAPLVVSTESSELVDESSDESGSEQSVKSALEYAEVDQDSEGPKEKSKAARLAQEMMDRDVQGRSKKGKPLSSLTFDDVKLTEEDIKEDIGVIWQAMHLFMNSRMVEAEIICTQAADHRLYYSVAYSLIQAIKSLATFEPDDLAGAIGCSKDSIAIASMLRKKDHGLLESGIRLAKGSTSVNNIKNMTIVQRHAELVYAECTLLKAVLGIVYSGDFIAFLKEALNMRNAYSIYRTLAKYVELTDAAYGGDENPAIDQDFRSGVFLGNGMISLILSLLPSTVLKIMEVFGFTGDRNYALETLMKAGRWKVGIVEPGMDVEKEGIRRQICDMVLLAHHLVIASYLPVGGVDIPTASNILAFNLDRYANGIFFLYFAGRLRSTETRLGDAVIDFNLAINAQREYVQLGHICYWDLGLVSLAAGDWQKGFESFSILYKESNWSKAIYAYAKAVTLYEQGSDPQQVKDTMAMVGNLMQRIAGKSLPLEKYMSRRSRKFLSQGDRLSLPGLELAYFLNCLGMSPRNILFDVHLDQISNTLAELHQIKDPLSYGGGNEYWDDYCLAHLLRGIVLRFIAFPEPHTKPNPPESPIPEEEAAQQAMISFKNVLKHGHELHFDHHLVWFAHYELGRLHESKREYAEAQSEYLLILSGKNLEISGKKGKGKVTLQNMAILRANSALQALKEDGNI